MRKFFHQSIAVLSAVSVMLIHGTLLPVKAEENQIDFSYLGAVGTFTAEQTQQIAETVYQSLAEHQKVFYVGNGEELYISDSDEDIDSVMNIYRAVVSAWDVGILTSRNLMPGITYRDGQLKLYPVYLETENYEAVYDELMQELDEIVSGVDAEWSDVEKALYLHDYIAVHYDYDYAEYEEDSYELELQHTAYGCLKSKKTVYAGYAWLYSILLHRVGIDSMMVESHDIRHDWNVVYIDGKIYHVDITWDIFSGHPGLVDHNNFLKSTADMIETDHTSTDWVLTSGQSVYDMDIADSYNGFWDNCRSAIQYYQGKWLVVNPAEDGTAWFDLCDFNAETGSTEIIHWLTMDESLSAWEVFDHPDWYYGGTFIIPVVLGEDIYYTTPKSVYKLEGDQSILLFDLDEEQQAEGYIYGMYGDKNHLYYYVSPSIYDDPAEYVYLLSDDQEETSTETVPETETSLPGDLNSDDQISIEDVILMKRYLLGIDSFSKQQYEQADILQDSIVNIFDLVALERLLLNA